MKILVVLLRLVFKFLFLGEKAHIDTTLEIIALRQQINVLQRSIKRPQIKHRDRIFWALLSKIYSKWKSTLSIVQPSTVTDWHQKGFKLFWKWKCRKRGRPKINWKLIKLIRKIDNENPLWSPQHIQGELAKLGITVCTNTVKKYIEKSHPKGHRRSHRGKRILLKDYLKKKDILVIYSKDINKSEKKADVPEQGYVWKD